MMARIMELIRIFVLSYGKKKLKTRKDRINGN